MKSIVIAIGNYGFNIAKDIKEVCIIPIDGVIVCDTSKTEFHDKVNSLQCVNVVILNPIEGLAIAEKTLGVSDIIPYDSDIILYVQDSEVIPQVITPP